VTSWGGAVPTALKRVLDDAEAQGLKMMSVLVVGGGGAPMPPELISRTKDVFPNSKHSFGYGYGLTESGAITIINWGDNLKNEPASPGQPMPTIQVQLRDEDGEVIDKDSIEGEIYVKSPSVMLGYYNNTLASKDSVSTSSFSSSSAGGSISSESSSSSKSSNVGSSSSSWSFLAISISYLLIKYY